jgi:hypothetical protein
MDIDMTLANILTAPPSVNPIDAIGLLAIHGRTTLQYLADWGKTRRLLRGRALCSFI